MYVYTAKGKEYEIRKSKAKEFIRKGFQEIEFGSCKNSLEEIIKLSEITKDVMVVTSDYHSPKWKLLSMKYLNKSKVIGAKTNYKPIKKLILYSIHTIHGISGLISSKLYHKIDELLDEYKSFIKNE